MKGITYLTGHFIGAIALAASSLPALGSEKQILVHVKGMVCAFCAQGITKKFSADAAVEHVDVSLEKHLVTLGLKENQALPDDRITGILSASGYSVEKIERP